MHNDHVTAVQVDVTAWPRMSDWQASWSEREVPRTCVGTPAGHYDPQSGP